MAWSKPQHSRNQVNRAGRILLESTSVSEDDQTDAMDVINNWRTSHAFPLNTFQMYLRRKASDVDGTSLVAQRVKRLSSIESKLRRLDWLKLSQMQDIGGCRAVVRDVNRIKQLVTLYRNSKIKHRLVNEDDYIAAPKESGYRGHHLVYRYYSDKIDTYNGLKVEIQIRSTLQHNWATAVETVGAFTRQALKSSVGARDWLRFFTLMGSEIAFQEKAPLVPGVSSDRQDVVDEIKDLASQLSVERQLRTYSQAMQISRVNPGLKGSHYFLLVIRPDLQRTRIQGFRKVALGEAADRYLKAEKEVRDIVGGDAVLVSAGSLAAVRRAYPNYFQDTTRFLSELKKTLTCP